MPKVPRKPNRARQPALPEGIAAAKSVVPKVKGRRDQTIVDYDPNQKQRYKSQYARYVKALELRVAKVDNSDPARPKYFYESERSSTGFWMVEELSYVGYGCTCPDFFKQSPANVGSAFKSEQVDREWVLSEAGAPTECKHIIATKLYRGEFVPVPNDPPLL